MKMFGHLLSVCFLACLLTNNVLAQQFQLSAAGLEFASKAFLSDSKLDVIDAQGQVNTYIRDLSYDTEDGRWMGYKNRQTGRVLRWPTSNSGNLQIGAEQNGQMQFTTSRMQIQPSGPSPRPGNAEPPVIASQPTMPRSNPLPGPGASSFPGSTIPDAGSLGSGSLSGGSLGSGTLGSGTLGGGRAADYQLSDWRGLQASNLFARVINRAGNNLPEPQPVHLVSYEASGSTWAVSQMGARLGCTATPSAQATWWVAPAGPGLVRLQTQLDGRVWAVTANDPKGLRLSMSIQDPRQLWRICPGPHDPGQYLLESAYYVGNYMTHLGAGRLGLMPWLATPSQLWVTLTPPQPQLAMLQPFWRNVSREIRPNAPLPPAEVELSNTHRYALTVLIGDLRSGQVAKTLRIEPYASETVMLERDAGATVVEVVETMTPSGSWNRQEFVTPIPPVGLYDLSVYEEFLQSIAIDRTGKSSNAIEDINYAPKSVGLLAIPAGEQLPVSGRIDVYAQSRAAENPGAVRRLNPKSLEKQRPDPLESILDQFQKEGGRVPGKRSFE